MIPQSAGSSADPHISEAGKPESYYGLFNDSFAPVLDGVTLTVDNYARWLDRSGRTPCIVTPRNPVNVECSHHILRYFSLPIRSRRPYRYGYPLADMNIWRDLRHTPMRLAHAHSPFSAGRLAVYAARQQKIPLIGTFHSKYRDDFEHSFKRFPWMTDLVMDRVLSFFNACDHVWIPQAKVEETVREYGFKGEVAVMENGNDFADFIEGDLKDYKEGCRSRIGVGDDGLSLLFVGQHIFEKGTDTIINALAAVRDKINFTMNFIGTGYAAEDLKRMVNEAGLGDRVHFRGIVSDRKSISDYYGGADLFLFPSPYDNAPLVVREAAAMGTPSILLKGSTAAEPITDCQNGFLIDRGSKALADRLVSLDGRRSLVAETGANARRSLVRSWRNVVDEVIERYDDIIATHSRMKGGHR